MTASELKKLLKRVVELVMPDLRAFYRVPRKGRIEKSYTSDGRYWADVQPLRNDDSVDPREPMIPKVEIPILWGGPERGVVCPPEIGTLCDITYYDGDPNYPRISNFRWAVNMAPACELGAFIIQQRPGVYISISPSGNLLEKTDASQVSEIGGGRNDQIGADWALDTAGNKDEHVGGDWTLEIGGAAAITATGPLTITAASVAIL